MTKLVVAYRHFPEAPKKYKQLKEKMHSNNKRTHSNFFAPQKRYALK
jgi:hypothetical protein